MRAVCIIACACALAGCAERGEPEPVGRWCETTQVLPVEPLRKYDLLVVVDESPRMAQEQASLAVNYQRFANVLENIEGGLPDIHLAVVSADLARDGQFQHAPHVAGCQAPSGLWLSDAENRDGTRTRNYEGSLADALGCIAPLGAGGGTFAQPLSAVRRALDGTHPEHAGFLRPEALLFVAVITDQDDCSANDAGWFAGGDLFACARAGIACGGAPLDGTPGAYADCAPYAPPSAALVDLDAAAAALKALKSDPSMVLVAGIAGNPTPVTVTSGPALAPSCSTSAAEAAPAIRLDYFLRQFPDRNTFTSLCNEDLSDAFVQVAQLLARTGGPPCMSDGVDLVDLDPARLGLQPDCALADVKNCNTAAQEATPLRRCDLDVAGWPVADQLLPCWWVSDDPTACPASRSHLLWHIERDAEPPQGTTVVARCAGPCG